MYIGAVARRPVVVHEPFTRSLLKLDIDPKVIETGETVSLAVIDQGFDKNNAALKYKKFYLDEGSPSALSPPVPAEYREHGTAVAAIAFGRDFERAMLWEERKALAYPGGIAPKVEVTCYNYKLPLPTNAQNNVIYAGGRPDAGGHPIANGASGPPTTDADGPPITSGLPTTDAGGSPITNGASGPLTTDPSGPPTTDASGPPTTDVSGPHASGPPTTDASGPPAMLAVPRPVLRLKPKDVLGRLLKTIPTNTNSPPPPPPPPPTHTPLPKHSSNSEDDSVLLILQKIRDANIFDVVSMSLYMNQTPALDEVIGEILDQGTIIVAGTSNEGDTTEMGYPACLPDVVSVGSLDRKGKLSNFTLEDNHCDVYTFGEVLAPMADGREENKDLVLVKGTSFATPAVAGLVCLVIQHAKDNKIDNKSSSLEIDNRRERKKIIMSFFKRKRGGPHFKLMSAEKDFLAAVKKDFDNFAN